MITPERPTITGNPAGGEGDICFDDYRWVPGQGLYRHDVHIPLPPKEQATLELLISLRGKVASHQLIERTVWPRQVVSYASMARCIYSLRQLLPGDGRPLIETVPKRGYRLDATFKSSTKQAPSSLQKSVDANPLAYSHYLAGIQQANDGSASSLARAIHYFNAALDSDSNYTTALSAICDVTVYQILRGYVSADVGFRRGIEAAQRALAIDPGFVPAMAVQGWMTALIGGDLSLGFKLIEQAEQADPEYAKLYVYLSWLLRASGDMQAAVSAAEIAVRIDPHQLLVRHARTVSLFMAGNTERALGIERKFCAEFPSDDAAHGYRAIFAASLGLHKEAAQSIEQALSLSPHDPILLAVQAFTLAHTGYQQRARDVIRQVETSGLCHCPAVWAASVYVVLGDEDAALRALVKGRESRCPWTNAARFDPRLEPLEKRGLLSGLYATASRG